jgi:hypothetical protein
MTLTDLMLEDTYFVNQPSIWACLMSSSDLIQEDHRAMLSSAEPITGDAISII